VLVGPGYPGRPWFCSIQETYEGRLWAGGVKKHVSFAEADRDIDGAIEAARCHGHGTDLSEKVGGG
jgi:hypothetical protein